QLIFSTGLFSGPIAVAVGDFNNDNRLDLVVANFYSNNVGVLLGYGDGTFTNPITYSTGDGSAPRAINIGYFNNDTRLDIVVSMALSNQIGILLNVGNGSFTNPAMFDIEASSYPVGIGVGDLNNDNWTDVMVVHKFLPNIAIFLGSGERIFASHNIYSTGTDSGPRSVAVADFNNDKILDIVVANSVSSNIGVLLGYGDGTFKNQTTHVTGVGSSPWSVAVGDFNKDFLMDIVVANRYSDNVGILFGSGDGTFGYSRTYSTGPLSIPLSVAVADFNRDNTLDIAVVNYYASNLRIFYGDRNGTFDDQKIYGIGYKSDPLTITVGDFNNDNWLDIAVIIQGTNSIEVLLKKC
ncbi:unnamed protein product, partial [Rotaria sp. Silwood2]